MQNENIIKRENNIKTFENLSKSVMALSQDISNFLSEEIEELNIHSYLFKNGLERCLNRVLNALYKQPLPVAIFPDSIPGFTLIAFKKDENIKLYNNLASSENKVESSEDQILNKVIGKYFDKNQQKVVLIENIDIIFLLFPIADTRKNLKDMELYITF